MSRSRRTLVLEAVLGRAAPGAAPASVECHGAGGRPVWQLCGETRFRHWALCIRAVQSQQHTAHLCWEGEAGALCDRPASAMGKL